MLFIPTGTDAPIYHWPFATVGMIILNIALMIAVPPPGIQLVVDDDGEETIVMEMASLHEKLALTLGDGLHPVQWVTHNFLHSGWIHLIGNMLFLFAFGVVVEGKVGPFLYVPIYVAIGTLHGAFTQTILLWSGLHGHAVGASAVVFGLLAICMVWAPRNEVHVVWIMWFWFRVFINHFDLRYTWLAVFYVGEQVVGLLMAGLTGRAAVSEAGHLSGALWGFVVGMGMLRLNWVDCEGWDVLSIWKKARKLAKDWKSRGDRQERQKKAERVPRNRVAVKSGGDDGPPIEDRSASALKKFRKLLAMGDIDSALSAYDRAARTISNWPDGPDLLALIKEMHANGSEPDSLILMRDYCRRYPAVSHRMRLKIAQILIRDRQKPTGALRTLAEIPEGALPPQLDAARIAMIRQAERMLAEGVLELEGED